MSNLSKKNIQNIMDRANKRLKELEKDVIIKTGVVFTSETDFYYVFTIYKDNKIIEKLRADTIEEFDKRFKDLTNKYEVNIIYDYDDLTINQLRFLAGEYEETPKPNKVEQTELQDTLGSALTNSFFNSLF